jgi:hypothetical protein
MLFTEICTTPSIFDIYWQNWLMIYFTKDFSLGAGAEIKKNIIYM